jgi:hypothetical protein
MYLYQVRDKYYKESTELYTELRMYFRLFRGNFDQENAIKSKSDIKICLI